MLVYYLFMQYGLTRCCSFFWRIIAKTKENWGKIITAVDVDDDFMLWLRIVTFLLFEKQKRSEWKTSVKWATSFFHISVSHNACHATTELTRKREVFEIDKLLPALSCFSAFLLFLFWTESCSHRSKLLQFGWWKFFFLSIFTYYSAFSFSFPLQPTAILWMRKKLKAHEGMKNLDMINSCIARLCF